VRVNVLENGDSWDRTAAVDYLAKDYKAGPPK